LQKLDRKKRKLLIIHGQHHQKGDADHWVDPRKRGRGLMQVEDAHIVVITKMLEYASSKVDPLKQIIRTHQHIINSTLLQTAR